MSMNTTKYPPETWYHVDKVITVLGQQQGLLSKNVTIPNAATGVSYVNIEIWTYGKGLDMFEVHYPEKILRKSASFEQFCIRHNLDLSIFDDCIYMK